MAISKTQPMRPAEIDLIDSVNQLEVDLAEEIANRRDADTSLGVRIDDEESARIAADITLDNAIGAEESARIAADTALSDDISAEVTARIDADTALSGDISAEVTARVNADGEIANIIGSGFSSSNTIASNIENLQGFDSRFRIGVTQAYTIAANSSQAFSVTFNNPYETTDVILAVVNPVGSTETFTNLVCVLDSSGPLGLDATITNNDTVNAYTVALGFIAIKVN